MNQLLNNQSNFPILNNAVDTYNWQFKMTCFLAYVNIRCSKVNGKHIVPVGAQIKVGRKRKYSLPASKPVI